MELYSIGIVGLRVNLEKHSLPFCCNGKIVFPFLSAQKYQCVSTLRCLKLILDAWIWGKILLNDEVDEIARMYAYLWTFSIRDCPKIIRGRGVKKKKKWWCTKWFLKVRFPVCRGNMPSVTVLGIHFSHHSQLAKRTNMSNIKPCGSLLILVI